jgi:hypothetical protein
MSFVTLTGIAASKTIPINGIVFYRVTAGQKGKERQCLQSETFLAHLHNCINRNIGNFVTKTTTGTWANCHKLDNYKNDGNVSNQSSHKCIQCFP